MERKCQTCANRFICPTFKQDKCCMGYNDKEVFVGLLKMLFMGIPEEIVDNRIKIVEMIQEQNHK